MPTTQSGCTVTSQNPIYYMTGRTTHTRFSPFRRSFGYPVKMVEVDVSRLKEAHDNLAGFSIGRFNLMSLRTDKYGDRQSDSLETWSRRQFETHGVSTASCSIHLISFPEVLGFGFSPISLWLLKDSHSAIKAIIYEVHNTFGEQHFYVAPFPPGSDRHEVEKALYVSPFWDVSGRYRFTFRADDNDLNLLIENIDDGVRQHAAMLSLRRTPATQRALIARTLFAPFDGLGVILAIHWQALRLWVKGAKYFKRPARPASNSTLTTQSSTTESNPGRLTV